MVLSAIFITDEQGKPLISRNYRSIPGSSAITDAFQKYLSGGGGGGTSNHDHNHNGGGVDDRELDAREPFLQISKNTSLCYVAYNDLYLLATSKLTMNSNCMLIVKFLYKLIAVFEDYFHELEEESIRDNFVIIYELLDEMCDFGYPQYTDSKLLQNVICVKEKHVLQKMMEKYGMGGGGDGAAAVSSTVSAVMKSTGFSSSSSSSSTDVNRHKHFNPNINHNSIASVKKNLGTLTGSVPWRQTNIKHKKNEVFLDVIEKLDLICTHSGSVISAEIIGTLRMKCFLSGMPELKLGINDKITMQRKYGSKSDKKHGNHGHRSKSVEMEDICFHPCVRLGRFENDRTISFVPPDGEFDLLTYRLNPENANVKAIIFIECQREIKSHSRIIYFVKCKSKYKRRTVANNVHILIPVPPFVDTPVFKCAIGECEYIPTKNLIVWKIRQLCGQREFLMKAQLGLPTIPLNQKNADPNRNNNHPHLETYQRIPIRVLFEIPYFTVSGVNIRYLKIVEKSGYHSLPWVRYITQNGEYQIRQDS